MKFDLVFTSYNKISKTQKQFPQVDAKFRSIPVLLSGGFNLGSSDLDAIIHTRQAILLPNGTIRAVATFLLYRKPARTSCAVKHFSRHLWIAGACRAVALHATIKVFPDIFNLIHLIDFPSAYMK